MHRKILICLDNSERSNLGARLGLMIAAREGASVTGCHVYAAGLHNERFRQMETTLPPAYQDETRLKDQREVHDTLITKGLKIISDSYNEAFLNEARGLGIEASAVAREGKNFEEIIKEATDGAYDLIVMGATGLGAVRAEGAGSVCSRVSRFSPCDVLAARRPHDSPGTIMAAIDGSPRSFGGLLSAIEMSKAFGRPLELVSAYDTEYHRHAFRSLSGVLSEEAGRLFKFKEQERLHEEVIDKGLGRVYGEHLAAAEQVAIENGVEARSTLLEGKPSEVVIRHVEAAKPFMLVVGKTGAHKSPMLDIGSFTERCLHETTCSVLISSRRYNPLTVSDDGVGTKSADGALTWTDEALGALSSIPEFARGIVRLMAEDAARKDGTDTITLEFMRSVRKKMGGE